VSIQVALLDSGLGQVFLFSFCPCLAMDVLARFFRSSVNSAASSAKVSKPLHTPPKSADCVFILGPGVDRARQELTHRATQEGLKIAFIGDGKNDVTQKMVEEARLSGIISATSEVICILHGHVKTDSEGSRIHLVQTNGAKITDSPVEKGAEKLTRTVDLISWLRKSIDSNQPDSQSIPGWGGNIHLASCHVAELNKEFSEAIKKEATEKSSSAPVWRQGNVITYGSNKPLRHKMAMENFGHFFRQLGYCKKLGEKTPDAPEILRNIMLGTSDTVSLLGGDLNSPMVGHAPKILLEAMPEYIQSQWAQLKAHADLNKKISKNPVENINLSSSVGNRGGHSSAISDEKIAGFVFTRINHLAKKEKFDQFKSELKQYPGLANVRDTDGNTPLIGLADKFFIKKNLNVPSSDIAQVLIDSGADINARNKHGLTALHVAISRGNSELVNFLIQKGARLDVRDEYERTPLHYACLNSRNRTKILKSVLSNCQKSEVDRRDLDGKTALHLAVLGNDCSAVDMLLQHGAKVSKKTPGWDNALDLAKRLKDGEKMIHLLKNFNKNKKVALG